MTDPTTPPEPVEARDLTAEQRDIARTFAAEVADKRRRGLPEDEDESLVADLYTALTRAEASLRADTARVSDAASDEMLVALAEAVPGSCDWGGCDNNALLARHDSERGWLPVCQWHAGDASAADLAPITAIPLGEAWDGRADTARVPEGLDVERLARAILNTHTRRDPAEAGTPRGDYQCTVAKEDAEAYAAEYAALATSPEGGSDD